MSVFRGEHNEIIIETGGSSRRDDRYDDRYDDRRDDRRNDRRNEGLLVPVKGHSRKHSRSRSRSPLPGGSSDQRPRRGFKRLIACCDGEFMFVRKCFLS